jgi:hypothetical protein
MSEIGTHNFSTYYTTIISRTNKPDSYDTTEIVFIVLLNTINITHIYSVYHYINH